MDDWDNVRDDLLWMFVSVGQVDANSMHDSAGLLVLDNARRLAEAGRKHWGELHSRRNPTREWFEDWVARIPSFGCACKEHFASTRARVSVGFDDSNGSAEWFSSTHELHNDINVELHRPLMSLTEAMKIWRPDLLPNLEPIDGLLAVTSLRPFASELAGNAKTVRCLESWRRLGLSIACVQQPGEVNSLRDQFPQVDRWIEASEWNSCYSRPTVLISDMLRVAAKDTNVLLINSDIEIEYDELSRTALAEASAKASQDHGACSVGRRWDYVGNQFGSRNQATPEPYGLDAFVLSPQQVSRLTPGRYEIGKPMWDYWLPFGVRFNGHAIRTLPDKMFWHAAHDQQWTQAEWTMGRDWFESEYGTVFDWHQFRQELIPSS